MEAAAAAVELKAGASWADDEVDEGASSFSSRDRSGATDRAKKRTLPLLVFATQRWAALVFLFFLPGVRQASCSRSESRERPFREDSSLAFLILFVFLPLLRLASPSESANARPVFCAPLSSLFLSPFQGLQTSSSPGQDELAQRCTINVLT
jgi:hypothetical protein